MALRKQVSITIPVFNNAQNLPFTLTRLLNLKTLLPQYDFEFLFVDDGSKDNSLQVLLEAQQNNPRDIKIVKLTRNFGAVSAHQAALKLATGDCLCHFSADLQDPPELLTELLLNWEAGNKVVLAVRSDRDESFHQKLFSRIYYSILRKIALPAYPEDGFDVALLDRQVIDVLNTIDEKNTHLTCLIIWLGYSYKSIAYVRQKRQGGGKSQWTFFKKIKLAVDSYVSFSYVPIRAMIILGFLTAMLSFGYGFLVLVSYFTVGIKIPGFTTLALLISFFSGTLMVMLGVLGEYVWRILEEIKKRPTYIIDEIYTGQNQQSG